MILSETEAVSQLECKLCDGWLLSLLANILRVLNLLSHSWHTQLYLFWTSCRNILKSTYVFHYTQLHEIWQFVACFMNVNFICFNYKIKYKTGGCICMCCGSHIFLLSTSEFQWKVLFFIYNSVHVHDCQFQTHKGICILTLKGVEPFCKADTHIRNYAFCKCITSESNLLCVK